MKVLIDPKITISQPVRNKQYGFKIFLSKKDREQLTIKAFSHCGKSRGDIGKIVRTGEIIKLNKAKVDLPVITEAVRMKIDILLDLMYGQKRDKKVEVCKGFVYFNKNRK